MPEPQPLPPSASTPTAVPPPNGTPAPTPPYAAAGYDVPPVEAWAPQVRETPDNPRPPLTEPPTTEVPEDAWAPPVWETPDNPRPVVDDPTTTELPPSAFEPPVPTELAPSEPPPVKPDRGEPARTETFWPQAEIPAPTTEAEAESPTEILDTAEPEPKSGRPEPLRSESADPGPNVGSGAGVPDAYFWGDGTSDGDARDTGGFARSNSPWPAAPSQLPERPTPTAESLRPETLVRGRRQAPGGGWRRAVYTLTGGLVHPGESAEELRRRDLINRVKTPVAGGHYRLAVLSLKGGVGKTTTTAALGSMLASLRGDRVLAVDANPDRGTLSDKVRLESAASIRDLLNERDSIQRYADFRAYTSQAVSRLEILASDRDPAVSEAFSEKDYREVSRILEHFYSICLTDCGTGLLHSAMAGVLGLADQIVLVSSPSVDGARSASATLDWLEAHQYGDLVRGGLVVLSMVNPKGRGAVDLAQLEEHFRRRCRSVVKIPWDTHLEEGAEIDLDRLDPATRDAYLELAAYVGEAFAWPR
ncbi:AAA family ATPase [Spiractinospora alimapuensis]|nr:AAA family ATPase [Spiractinospora alimapuensis]